MHSAFLTTFVNGSYSIHSVVIVTDSLYWLLLNLTQRLRHRRRRRHTDTRFSCLYAGSVNVERIDAAVLIACAVIGLTGGIATGKSSVSKLLQERNIPVIDADVLARKVVKLNTHALRKIVATFGDTVLLPDGSLDRKRLGEIVFNDEVKRKRLNAIVHPAVRWEMLRGILGHWMKGEKVCVLDIPLLIEAGLYRWVSLIAVVFWSVCPYGLIPPTDIFSFALARRRYNCNV